MGWNSSVKLGGTKAAFIGIPIAAVMYLMIVLMTSEMACAIPESGGQYSMAKYLLGPVGAFNIGLMMVLQYAMLEAADALVVGQLLKAIIPGINPLPFLFLSVLSINLFKLSRYLRFIIGKFHHNADGFLRCYCSAVFDKVF